MLIELAILAGGVIYASKRVRSKVLPYAHRLYENSKKTADPIAPDKTSQAPLAQTTPSRANASTTTAQSPQVVATRTDIKRKVYISGASLGLAGLGKLFYPPLALLSIPGLLYVSHDILKSAYHSLRFEKRVTVDAPIVLVLGICIFKGYFLICNFNTFLVMYSRLLLLKVKDDSQHHIVDVFKQQPHYAWVLRDGIEIEEAVNSLQVGDMLVVNAGETIAADGMIIAGKALVDQHILTGESQPAEKEAGDTVFALTLVLSGKIQVCVEKAGQDTTASQIGDILNQTTNVKTDMQIWAENLGNKMVVPTIVLSGVCWPLLGTASAIVILNSHPKYKTTIASYIGILNYLSIASHEGILIKDGRVLERLNQIDTLVFDKTGTLTEEQPHLVRIHAWHHHTEDAVLGYAALAERKQSHPIAKAILHAARQRHLPLDDFEETEYKIGYGLIVKTRYGLVRVGSLRFMEVEGLALNLAAREAQEHCQAHGHALVFVALQEQVIGAIELHATVREEAQSVIDSLREQFAHDIYILSGDHEAPTQSLAQQLGIEHYFAKVLPEDKASLIKRLQQEGKSVCFIGDGINDSIALKTADVSISLRGASTVATDTAQVILMDQSLKQLTELFVIAREYQANTKLTFMSVTIPHLMGMSGGLFFRFGLVHSVILNNLGLALGAGNSVVPRLRQRQRSDTIKS